MIDRVPEEDIVMEKEKVVNAFYNSGKRGGPLFPIYQFSSIYFTKLIPFQGKVIDLFCGAGNSTINLLSGRPDLKVVGIDLSEEMLKMASSNLKKYGFDDRVQLIHGDASLTHQLVNDHIDGIYCISSLHHCPKETDLTRVLNSVKTFQDKLGSAIWLFDLVRPESSELVKNIPLMYEFINKSSLDPVFKVDWENSLLAGWTFEEFTQALKKNNIDTYSSHGDYSQLHWAPPKVDIKNVPRWQGVDLTQTEHNVVNRLINQLDVNSLDELGTI